MSTTYYDKRPLEAELINLTDEVDDGWTWANQVPHQQSNQEQQQQYYYQQHRQQHQHQQGLVGKNWIAVLNDFNILQRILATLGVRDLCRFAQVCRAAAIAVRIDKRWLEILQEMAPSKTTASAVAASSRSECGSLSCTSKRNASFGDDFLKGALPSEIMQRDYVDAWKNIINSSKISGGDRSALFRFDDLPQNLSTARLTVAWVWVTLTPYCNSLCVKRPHLSAFKRPREQARLLANLRRFVAIDPNDAALALRVERIAYCISLFEAACLEQLDLSLLNPTRKQIARQFSEALIELNSGSMCRDHFINTVKSGIQRAVDPLLSLISSREVSFNIEPLHVFLHETFICLVRELDFVHSAFPAGLGVDVALIERLLRPDLVNFVATIFENIDAENKSLYLIVVVATFQQCLRFQEALTAKNHSQSVHDHLSAIVWEIFEPHQKIFLTELEISFKKECDDCIEQFKQAENDEKNENLSSSDESKCLDTVEQIIGSDSDNEDKATSAPTENGKPTERFEKRDISSTSDRQLEQLERPDSSALAAGRRHLLKLFSAILDAPVLMAEADTTAESLAQRDVKEQINGKIAELAEALAEIKSILNLELVLSIAVKCKGAIDRARLFLTYPNKNALEVQETCQKLFSTMIETIYTAHIKPGFEEARMQLKMLGQDESDTVLQPLADFYYLMQVADLIQEIVEVFFNREIKAHLPSNDFTVPVVRFKKSIDKAIDDNVARGLNEAIMIIVDQVERLLAAEQMADDYRPRQNPGSELQFGHTAAAEAAVSFLRRKTDAIVQFAEKNITDVFFREIGLRFFQILSKHIRRYKISIEGAPRLISDMNLYYDYISSLKQQELETYFAALKELGSLFLIEGQYAKSIGQIASDSNRFSGLFKPEDLYEFAQCRTDWIKIRRQVERVTYGFRAEDCILM